MKNIKWSAVFIGVLSGLGTLVAGVLVFALILLFLLGESVAELRGHPGIGTYVMFFVLTISSLVLAGYVTARLSQPAGVRHALLTALVFIILSLLGGFDGPWVLVRIGIPILCCVFGAFLAPQR